MRRLLNDHLRGRLLNDDDVGRRGVSIVIATVEQRICIRIQTPEARKTPGETGAVEAANHNATTESSASKTTRNDAATAKPGAEAAAVLPRGRNYEEQEKAEPNNSIHGRPSWR